MVNYIKYAAAVRGIDPDTAVAVANQEGLNTYVGDYGSSFGPFQLHYGNVAGGGNRVAGMGDDFTQKTGLDARDPTTVRQQIDFALDGVKQNGWGAFHGAARAGVGPHDGIGTFTGDANQFRPQPSQPTNAAPAQDVQAQIDSPDVQQAANAAQATAENVADAGGGLLGVASSAIGSKYVWGGKGGRTNFDANFVGSDCSGFVAWAFKVATGIDLPAQTSAIYKATQGVSADQAQPGDLVEYNMGQGPQLEHVGIYLGNGKVLHDSSLNPDGGVEVTTLDWTRAHIGRDVQFRRVPGLTPDMVGNLAGGVGAGAEGPTMSKATAAYKASSGTRNCADCTMFRKPNDCTLVMGHIHPGGTCKHFEGKVGAGQDDQPDDRPWWEKAKDTAGQAFSNLGQGVHDLGQNVEPALEQAGLAIIGTPVEPPKPEDIPPTPEYLKHPEEPRVEEQLPVVGPVAKAFRDWSASQAPPADQPAPGEPPASLEDRQKAAEISNIAGMASGVPAAPLAQTPKQAEAGVQEQLQQRATGYAAAASMAVPVGGATVPETMALGAAGSAVFDSPNIVHAISTGDPGEMLKELENVGIAAVAAPVAGIGSAAITRAARMLPAPIDLTARAVTATLQALRAPGEAAADAAFQAATHGATRGLDETALRAVPAVMRNPVPNAAVAQMFRDAQKLSRGPGGKFTAATARLAREAKRLDAAGTTQAPMTGADVAALFKRIAPGQADQVLTNHGLPQLTTPYINGSMASRGVMPAVAPHIARTATNMVLGGAGGAALAQVNTDPSDPNHFQKVVNGGLVGMALMSGNPYITSFMSKDVLPTVLRTWNSINNPLKNLNASNTMSVMDSWIRSKLVLNTVDRTNLLQKIERSWGDPSNYRDVAIALEQTGQLPAALQAKPEAVDAWQQLVDTWNKAVKAKVADDVLAHPPVLNNLPDGRPSYMAQFAIHHVPQDEWMKARAAASMGLAPEAMAEATRGNPIVRGPISRFNVLSHMFKERTYASFEEGEAHGVQYDFSNLPHLLSDQYASQLQAIANKDLAAKLQGLVVQSDRLPTGTTILDHDLVRVPARLGAPPAGMTGFQPAEKLGLSSLLGSGGRGANLFVSDSLANTLNAAFKEQGLFENTPWLRDSLRKALQINSYGKEMVLGGSAFHMWNEINTFIAANGLSSLTLLPKLAHLTMFPGAFEKFVAANEADIRQAVYQGMTWNILPELKSMNLTRGLVFAGSTAGAGTAAYAGAKATGKSDEDAWKYAAIGGLLAAGLNLPVGYAFGKEWSSMSTMFSDALFTRTIPAMKLMTWEMNGKSPEAATWVNEAFGGENLQMLLRSRSVTDLLRLFVLAPDWTGSFIRQIGGALMDPSSKGSLNRGFWVSAALNSVIMVEGLNLLLAGHPSWQNPPGQEGTVDLTPTYDKYGWKHASPSSGEPAGVYLDILPAWRGLVDPWRETARWGLSALAQTDQGQQLGLNRPEITGGLKTGQPGYPDPAAAWGQYLTARGGLIPSTAAEFAAQTDFAGRPLNHADDQWWQRLGNNFLRSTQRFAPAGTTAAVAAVERGAPTPVAVTQGLTGLRTRNVTDYAQAQQKREWEIEHGLPSYPWQGMSLADQQQAKAQYQSRNADVANRREAVRSDPTLTPADKAKKMQGAEYQFETLSQYEESLVPPEIRDRHPDLVQKFKNDMTSLDAIRGNASGEQQADYIGSDASGLSPDALFNEAWNRDDKQLSQAKTEADRAALRRQWLTDAANQHGIDHDVLEDFVKARLFGETLDPLPGMSSANLNIVRDAYEVAAKKSPDDITTARALEQQVVAKYAKAFGVDAGALQRRVYLRTVAPKEQSPADQSYNRGITVLENTHNITTSPKYMNEDGTPMGTPDDWVNYDNQLASTSNWDKYRGQYINRDLEAKAQAKARGAAQAALVAYKSPGFWDYERWFGTGRTMTDAQWQQYRAGTLDMWRDNPDPKEAQNRNNVVAMYKALTPQERLQTSVTMNFFGQEWPGLTIEAAVRDLNKIRSNAWKAGNIGLPQNITNADAPPGADLSLVDTTGNTP